MPDNKTHTYFITIEGIVQGVGFRPFVFGLAQEMQLRGRVSNQTAGVGIKLTTTEVEVQQFVTRLKKNAPSLAMITQISIETIDFEVFSDFKIVESHASGKGVLLLTPDFGLCENCRQELHDPAYRRYRYPFTTCTHCGPRYSIVEALPYDRPTTTMRHFEMCTSCTSEYHQPTDRRFFAQTISCHDCGPLLSWYKCQNQNAVLLSNLHDSRWILPRVKWALASGKILAVKGIGGYLLICDATNVQAVENLRKRKHRPDKPFALLYPSLTQLEKDVWLNEAEKVALQSPAAPIVLTRKRSDAASGVVEAVAPDLAHWGVMLPYTPLFELICHDFGKPVVATSGNVSGSPIVFEDEAALRDLTTIADYVLAHNRPIVMPQDDSVLRISPQTQQPIFVRRSRGYAPNFLGKTTAQLGNNLAFGASLKATFCVQSNKQLFVSQHLGEIESYDTQIQFGRVLAHLTAVLQTKENDFQRLFCDAHEGYASTQMAREFSEQHHIPLRKIQHHEAHLAAVLAENNAFAIPQKTLGVVWDGTGYGTDGQVWGGEFFVLPSNDFRQAQRLHFAYFDAIVADKMPREPRLSALSLCQNNTRADDLLRPLFSATEWTFYQKTLQKNTLKTSSMGRIFDGVAALLGLLDVATYEGQAAMLLETEALRFFEQNGYDFDQHYPVKFTVENNVCTHSLVANVVEDILAQRETGLIAAQFHLTLVRVVAYVARLYQVQAVAFSGGVFQNAVLTDLLRLRLGHSYKLYFHQQLPPNDECISFGQMVLGTGI